MDEEFKPAPQELAIGTPVTVRLNKYNRTPHSGVIINAIWHGEQRRWHYFLRDENGRKVSKRYAAEDLEVVT